MRAIPPFVALVHITFFAACAAGGLRGGHPERRAVAVLLIVEFISACSYTSYGYRWRIGDVYISSAIESFVLMLAIGWLAFRSNRWWPFLATASLALTLMVHGLTVVTDIPWDAAVSARVGFNILLNVSLLAGVAERWLAGERAAGDRQMWRRR